MNVLHDNIGSGLDWRTKDSIKLRNWYACLLVKEHYVVGFQRVHEFAIFDDEVLANTYSWMSTRTDSKALRKIRPLRLKGLGQAKSRGQQNTGLVGMLPS